MSARFDNVVAIMARLRAPGGCPWDRKQTHESLKPYLIEETYEALDTIDRQDFAKLKEELGDVLLQVLFHSQIGTEAGTFTIDDVLEQLSDKLVRRHPHVFGDGANRQPSLNSDQVVHRWEDIKRAERKNAGKPDSVLHDIPQALPALLRAYQTQVRTARVGFDWPDSPQGLGGRAWQSGGRNRGTQAGHHRCGCAAFRCRTQAGADRGNGRGVGRPAVFPWSTSPGTSR
jgi:tetrapyrrole methylase family protein/MazG family protein